MLVAPLDCSHLTLTQQLCLSSNSNKLWLLWLQCQCLWMHMEEHKYFIKMVYASTQNNSPVGPFASITLTCVRCLNSCAKCKDFYGIKQGAQPCDATCWRVNSPHLPGSGCVAVIGLNVTPKFPLCTLFNDLISKPMRKPMFCELSSETLVPQDGCNPDPATSL